MATCSECDTVLDFDAEEAEEGDVVVCVECGTEYEIVATEPLELAKVDDDGIDDEDDEFSEEEEE